MKKRRKWLELRGFFCSYSSSSHLILCFFFLFCTNAGLMHCIMIYFDWESFRRVIKTLRITGLRQLQGILDLLIVDC